MKGEQALVPKLRFGEFEGRWSRNSIGHIFSFKQGVQCPVEDQFASMQKGLVRFIRIIDLTQADEKPRYIKDPGSEHHVQTSDLFMVRYGSPGLVGYRYSGVIANNLFRIMPHKPHKTDNDFFYHLFGSINKEIEAISGSSTMPAISFKTLNTLFISTPSLPEQEKIAAFLTSVDDRIDQLKRKKSLLQDYKKGAMQKLFSQELRFKDEQGKDFPDWEEKKLGELGETYGGLSGKSGGDFGEGKPYVTYSQIFGSSVIDIEKCKLVRIDEDDRQNQIKKGDILFTTSSETRLEVGFTSVVLEEPNEVYLNSFCFGFRLNSFDALRPEFARYLFHSSEVRRSIAVLGQGSTRYNISKKELMKQELLLPTVPEQTKIANFLSSLDQKIEQVDTQITQTQTFKKGLLQQMFV